MSTQPSTLPRIVLDTNVVLDWLVFRNPGVAPITAAIESLSVRWLMNDAIRAELADVLSRKPWRSHEVDTGALWECVERWAHATEAPSAVAHHRMACRDRDDQKFIDLALGTGAAWLISRDKAVLALARRAKLNGLHIVKPEAWQLDAHTTGTTVRTEASGASVHQA